MNRASQAPFAPVVRSLRSTRRAVTRALLLIVCLGFFACASPRAPEPAKPKVVERGLASWYGAKFHGRLTANGEVYDMHEMTAAHKELPFDTLVEVRNLDNGRSVRVRINDRGPFIRGRVIDLSYAAAQQVGLVGPGVARVELAIVPAPRTTPAPVYTVQLGAFEDAYRANAFRQRLENQEIDARVRTDGGWHRVQAGEFANRADAEAARRFLARQGWTALVVRLPR
jgi:rare lipoprotein A